MIQRELFLQEQYSLNLGITAKTTTGSHKCLRYMLKHKSDKYFSTSLTYQFPEYFHHFVPLLLLHITDTFKRQKVYGMVYRARDFEVIRLMIQKSSKHFTWFIKHGILK